MTAPPLPPPGWYPDTAGSGGRAYWNGHVWSEPPKPSRNPWLVVALIVAVLFVIFWLIGTFAGVKDKTLTGSTTTATPLNPLATTTQTARPPSPVPTTTFLQTTSTTTRPKAE